jgi:anti-sigma-K factor RskA
MPFPNTSPSNLADLYLNDHPAQPQGVSAWWRAISIALLILLGLGIASAMSMYEQFKAQMEHMQTQLRSVPQIKALAVLTDDKHAPAMLITQDPQETTLQLQRLSDVAEGQEDSMQLWALSGTQRPVSLGVLSAKVKMQRLNATDQDLAAIDTLAISVENKGGVSPSQGPRLPYLFQGAIVHKAR